MNQYRPMRTLIIALTALYFTDVSAQDVKAPVPRSVRRNNIIYAELGGVCAFYSLNYQRNVPLSRKVDVAAGLSIGPVILLNSLSSSTRWSPRIGIQAQAIYKMGQHELGVGPSYCLYTYRYTKSGNREAHYGDLQSAFMGQFGYSYTSKQGLYLGAYFTPILFDYGYFDFVPWGGLRFGYRF